MSKGDPQMRSKIENAELSKNRTDSFAAADPRTEVLTMADVPSRVRKTTAKTAANPEILDQIGQHLGKVYNDILSQPVPDRFLDLLQCLESGGTTKRKSDPQPVEAAGVASEMEAKTAGERKKAPK